MANLKTTQEDAVSDVALDDLVRIALAGGGNAKATISQIADAIGAGDVSGPVSATDSHVVMFDGATGKLIKDSGLTLAGTNTGDQTSVSGNAGTATALQTARTIDGQSFDGTANITVIAPGTHAATSKATPVDADELPLVDSAASNVLKKLTWANLKATLKTYLDTLYQPTDSDLTTIAGLTATTDSFIQSKSSAWASRTVAQVTTDLQGDGLTGGVVGFRNIPQNSQSAAYTTVAADSGKHILHPSGDANARTFTIDSNANVAYPVGTAITFINQTSQVVTIAITSDTLTLAGSTTTGSRALAQNGVATAIKVASTSWIISGTGLT